MSSLENYKSLNEASEKEMLQYILASQLTILRRLDFLDSEIKELKGLKDVEITSHADTTKNMMDNIPPFIERINEFLALSDADKFILRL